MFFDILGRSKNIEVKFNGRYMFLQNVGGFRVKFYQFKLFCYQYQLESRLRSWRNFARNFIHKILAKNKKGFNRKILSQFFVINYTVFKVISSVLVLNAFYGFSLMFFFFTFLSVFYRIQAPTEPDII